MRGGLARCAAALAVVAGLAVTVLVPVRAAEPIVIGMSAAFAGSSRGLGIELYRGSQAYLAGVNAGGGIDGRPVVVKAYDDGYNPSPAIFNTIKLIEQDHALLLFNYVGTPTVTRVLPLLKRYSDRSMFLFFPFSGAQVQRDPPYEESVFNLRASYRDETYGLVDRFASVGRKKIAIFYQADAYGRSGWDGVRRALIEHKLPAAEEATYQRGAPYTTDMSAQVAILRRANPDAIISIGAYAACAAFIRDVVNAGWKVPIANVSFVGAENMIGLLLKEQAKAGRDYTSQLVNSEVVPSYEDTSLPAVREYRAAMETVKPMPPAVADVNGYTLLGDNYAGFEGFLNAKLLVEALRRMNGDIQPSRIRSVVEGIRDLNLGIDESVSFGPDRHQALQYVYYARVDKGRLVTFTDWGALAR
jgi:ABC-type branched-subunit amino acid transport system substrate-binding protein